MFQNKKVSYWALISLLIISLVIGLNITLKRYFFEVQNNTVEMVVSYREMSKLALAGGMDRSKLLIHLSQKVGVTSIALEEETLQDFISGGKITMLNGSEIINMLRVGKVYRTILTHLTKKTRVKKNKIYLIVDEFELYERVKGYLKVTLNVGSVKEIGWNILELTANKDQLLEIGFGVSGKRANELAGYGFTVIPRFRNNTLVNDSLLKLKFKDYRCN